MKIKIVDSQDGKTLWEDFYDIRFHEGDIPPSSNFGCFFLGKDIYQYPVNSGTSYD